MHVYLVPWAKGPSRLGRDSWHPDGFQQEVGWSALDLRPTYNGDGYALVFSPLEVRRPQLGTLDERVSLSRVANRLRTNFAGRTVRDVLRQVAYLPQAWGRVQPVRRAHEWIWSVDALGVTIDELRRPVVQGGAGGRYTGTGATPTLDTGTPTDVLDTFNRADGGLGANWDVSWGIVAILSNRWYVDDASAADNIVGTQWIGNSGGAMPSANHWCSTELAVYGGGAPSAGWVVRYANDGTFEGHSLELSGGNIVFVTVSHDGVTDPSPSTYLSTGGAATTGHTYRGEAEGSTFRLKDNGSQMSGGSATSTAYPSNVHVGLHGHTGTGSGDVGLDTFMAGAL